MITTARNRWGTEYLYLVCSGRTRKITDRQRQAMPAQVIEELIEDEYQTIALSPALRDSIEELVLEDLDVLQAGSATERQQMENQRIELSAQRQKLLDAHYVGAIPLDLLKSEQDRIAGRLTRISDQLTNLDANFEQARAVLADTLDLTRDCHGAYMEANDGTRRLFNQAFFAKIYIDEDDETREQSVRIDYNEPFDSLLSRLVTARVHHELDIKKTAHQKNLTGGSNVASSGTAEVQGSHTDTLVVLARLFSNSTSSSLQRAVGAYRQLDLATPISRLEVRTTLKRAIRLNDKQLADLAERYKSGSSVYQLATEFEIDRRTVSTHLKDQGVQMRNRAPADHEMDEIVLLYQSGLSLVQVGERVNFSADSVLSCLKKHCIERRSPHRRRSSVVAPPIAREEAV